MHYDMLSAPMPLPTQSRSGGPGRAENAVCPPAMVDRYTLWLAVGCTNSKQARNRCTPRDKINLLLKKSSRCPSTVTGKGRPRACELHYRTGGRTWPPLGGSRWEAVIPSVDIEGVGPTSRFLDFFCPAAASQQVSVSLGVQHGFSGRPGDTAPLSCSPQHRPSPQMGIP